jgi:hypothetical protein
MTDAQKKLKNDNKNELWQHFKQCIKAYITQNVPLMITNPKFLEMPIDEIKAYMKEYLNSVNIEDLKPSIKDQISAFILDKITDGSLNFDTRDFFKQPTKYCDSKKQLFWEVNF